MKRMKLLLCALALAVVGVSATYGQDAAKLKALYLFQFAKGTAWSPEDNGKPFVITVIGDKNVSKELTAIVGSKTIGNRQVTIKQASSAAGLPASEILYLGEEKSSMLPQLLSSQVDNTVLIVAGAGGLCEKGAGIAFNESGERLTFDISETNIARYGLKVSPKLVQKGRPVL